MQHSLFQLSTREIKHPQKPKSLKAFPDNYVVLDIETTGLNPRENEIIELSALKVENNRVVKQFSTLVKPEGRISSYITNLTGITQSMTENAPDIKSAIKLFSDFCSDSIIMGHNVKFDISFINTNLEKHHNTHFSNDYVDTLRLARIYLKTLPNRKLGTIASFFNLDTTGMHRGLKDCIVTNICFQKMKEMAKNASQNSIE